MKKILLFTMCLLAVTAVFMPGKAAAQGNITWEEIWVRTPPPLAPDTAFNYFMRNAKGYTGMAYDRFRDLLYIVSPQQCVAGTIWWNCPRVYVWDAMTGTPAYSVGRSADANRMGKGGELPVPLDTIVPGRFGYGFSQSKYCMYKIDVDDEGRIFGCNLVSPVWGVCIDLDGDGNCDGVPNPAELDWLQQGPFRVYVWDTPKSTPLLKYATMNAACTARGQFGDSEQSWTRFGDAFDVVGKRSMYDPGGGKPLELLDSVRIYTSGGSWLTQPEWNREVNMIIGDYRPAAQRPNAEKGNKQEYRLGVKLVNSNQGLSCHGVAATGVKDVQEIWMESCPRVTTAAFQVFYGDYATNPAHALPQTYSQEATGNRSLSLQLTGDAGTIKFFDLPQFGRKFLICAGGTPTGGVDPGIPNQNTSAKVLDVTSAGNDFEQFSFTPQLGNKALANMSAEDNYCSDIEYKFDTDDSGLHLIVFVLMSNNGIACYRTRGVFPVELTTLRGTLVNENIELEWQVTNERNNYGFEVMRSFDGGRNWELAGFVPGRGTTNIAYEYKYTDPLSATHTNVGAVKYRLRQIDTDGKINFSPIVDVYIGSTPSAIELLQNYPNPFNPTTTIGYQISKPGHVSLKVFNALGEQVGELVNEAKEAGTYQVSMSSENLPSGTYMYQINVDGSLLQKKMVVMK